VLFRSPSGGRRPPLPPLGRRHQRCHRAAPWRQTACGKLPAPPPTAWQQWPPAECRCGQANQASGVGCWSSERGACWQQFIAQREGHVNTSVGASTKVRLAPTHACFAPVPAPALPPPAPLHRAAAPQTPSKSCSQQQSPAPPAGSSAREERQARVGSEQTCRHDASTMQPGASSAGIRKPQLPSRQVGRCNRHQFWTNLYLYPP